MSALSDQRAREIALGAATEFQPQAPIDNARLFAGRGKQITAAVDAVAQIGLHIVIFGETGVGKTSLASVISPNLEVMDCVEGSLQRKRFVVKVNTQKHDKFGDVWKRAFREIFFVVENKELMGFHSVTHSAQLDILTALNVDDLPANDDVRRALGVLPRSVFIFDEFDRGSEELRTQFTDLIKTLSDTRVDSTLVLVGVADTVNHLIRDHRSISRAAVQIPLPRMSERELAEILENGANALRVHMDPRASAMIVALSQGLPHYTHLLGLHAVRAAAERRSDLIEIADVYAAFEPAIARAVQSIQHSYLRAVHSARRDALHEHVILACAFASASASARDALGYFHAADVVAPLGIILNRKNVSIATFQNHLNEFCKEERSAILEKDGVPRAFKYRFHDPIMLPYILMTALAKNAITPAQLQQSLEIPSSPKGDRIPTSGAALWQERLIFLQSQEPIATDPLRKFLLKKQMEEARANIDAYAKETNEATPSAELQEKRIRDFAVIVDRALASFNIPLSEDAPERKCLAGMIDGQRLCNPENLRIVGNGLWTLVSDTIAQGGRHEDFDACWTELLTGLRRRFFRANTSEQWAELQEVLNHSMLEERKWNEFLTRWVHAPFPVLIDPETSSALAPYRRHIVESFREINLSGFGGAAARSDAEGKAELAQVYIDLDTKAEPDASAHLTGRVRRHWDLGRIPVLQRLAENPRLVLIGLPGSGKSTVLRYFSLSLAQYGLKPEAEWLENLKFWPEEEADLVPVFVELRQFAASLPTPLPDVNGGQWITDYIFAQLKPAPLEDCADALKRALYAGRAIVFLEGLDEVPDDDRLRRFVLDTVKEFARGPFHDSRMVVTCRPRSYADPAWQLEGFEKAELAALDLEKIGRFIHRFYGEVARRDPHVAEVTGERVAKLEWALCREELRELATNPLMLTVMAWLHRFEELPHKRALILNTLVEQLLFKWEERKRRDDRSERRTLTEFLHPYGLGINSLRRVLCRLAFESRRSNTPTLAGQPAVLAVSIPKQKLLSALEDLLPAHKASGSNRQIWALQVSQIIDQRTGLLVPEGDDSFIMPYKLQEFLAGEHLTDHDELETLGVELGLPTNESRFDHVVAHLVGANGYWEEVVKWAGAIQAHVKHNRNLARDLALALCEDTGDSESTNLRRAVIAAEILVEVGLTEVANTHRMHGPKCLALVREALDALTFSERLSPKQRAAAASARGWLEDLPVGVGLNNEGIPDIAWVDIRSGDFLMRDKTSPATAQIKTAFRISRYPVTVAQFQAFVDGGCYENEALWNWLPEANRWLQEMHVSWAQKTSKPGPEDYAIVFQTPNHPRVGVSWFEAVAYCKWLNAKLKLKENVIHLQSELEWERAARGAEGRAWTSRDQTELWRHCNVDQTKIEHTSAVGLFPAGDTPTEDGNQHGVAELIGNVWEWCRTPWMDTHSKKNHGRSDESAVAAAMVARGGSWSFGHDAKHLSPLRRGFGPGNRYDDVGFRLVCTV